MSRILKLAVIAYVGLGLLGLYRESQGELVCECDEECWCKRPELSVFRWVFPIEHRISR